MKQMQWNSYEQAYFGVTSEGRRVRVEADEMAEAALDAGVDTGELSGASVFSRWEDLTTNEQELLDPNQWQTCIGANQNVSYCDMLDV